MSSRSSKEQRHPTRPIAIWKETDILKNTVTEVKVIILNSPGCSWAKKAGCTMCGYNNDVTCSKVSHEDLIAQMEIFLSKYDGESYIKIFTSGSFLDPEEIDRESQKWIISKLSELDDVKQVLIESRPEYMTEENLVPLQGYNVDIEIAVGLETSSDRIRSLHISKGFSFDQFRESGEIAVKLGFKLKTYLLMKPPLIGEAEAITDMIKSIRDVDTLFPGSRISVNPMNIQAKTQVESLFSSRKYRPPWLWSLLEVLKEGQRIIGGKTHIMSSPTAGGKRRGVHNCGKCDEDILRNITAFSLNNSITLAIPKCDRCFERWKEQMDISRLSPGNSDRT